MDLSLHALSIGSFVPMMRTLSDLLDKGAAHAADKGFDPAVLIADRLTPDMFPLSFQVQFVCQQTRGFIDLLLRRPPTEFDHEAPNGLEDLKALIAETIAYLDGLPESAFDGAAEREVTLPLQDGLVLRMNGVDFVQKWIAPQVYFHVTIAYAILRHDGVPLGIQDFGGRIMGEFIGPAGAPD
jgi:hypothetical protein